jgi:hypothetical protein
MMRVLTAIGCVAAIAMIAASATMNFLFMYSLGRSPFEGQVLGAVSVAVDVMKALLVVFIAKAATDGKRGFVVIGSGAFALFAIGSFIAAAGFAAVNRGAVTESRRMTTLSLQEFERDLAELHKRREALPTHRPVAVIEEALSGLRVDVRWKSSLECATPSSPSQRELCAGAANIRAELAAAREGARLESAIMNLRDQRADVRKKYAEGTADPQAHFLAQLLGADEGLVQRVLMSLLALIVEVSSALGIYLATAHTASIRQAEILATVECASEPEKTSANEPPATPSEPSNNSSVTDRTGGHSPSERKGRIGIAVSLRPRG